MKNVLTEEELMELIANTLAELEALDNEEDDEDDIYDEVPTPTVANLGNGMGMICIVCDDDEIGAELAHHALRTLEQLCKQRRGGLMTAFFVWEIQT